QLAPFVGMFEIEETLVQHLGDACSSGRLAPRVGTHSRSECSTLSLSGRLAPRVRTHSRSECPTYARQQWIAGIQLPAAPRRLRDLLLRDARMARRQHAHVFAGRSRQIRYS